MTISLKPGAKLRSVVDATEVVVVKGAGAVDLRCGGVPMVASDGAVGDGEVAEGFAQGSVFGKRYASTDGEIEVLCVRAGDGSLSIAEELISVKDAKPLPASD